MLSGAMQIAGMFLLTSVPLYLLFWAWSPAPIAKTRIAQPARPRVSTPLKEAVLSLANMMLLLIPALINQAVEAATGFQVMYLDFSAYGWAYFAFSVIVILLIVDAEFYWVHYAFHRWGSKAHAVHHQFTNPTPFAGWAFHYWESLAYVLPYIPIMLFLPWHPYTVVTVLFITTLWNAFLHLGYNPLPAWRTRHPVLKWFMTATEHGRHHQQPSHDFGLYFSYWDKLMKTESPR